MKYKSYYRLSSLITVYQIFGPYLSRKYVKFLLSITLTFCIGKYNCILTINDDTTFYHKALPVSAFFVLGGTTEKNS